MSGSASWTVPVLETVLARLLATAHPTHYLVLQVITCLYKYKAGLQAKKALVTLMGHDDEEVTEKQLEYKVKCLVTIILGH